MKSMTKMANRPGSAFSTTEPRARVPAIQLRGVGSNCRTNACAAAHDHGQARHGPRAMMTHGHAGKVNLGAFANRLNQPPPITRAVSALNAHSYRVQSPVAVGGGSHQIRATLQGTAQIAGSVEISRVGNGRVYISNLQVDQQHRRRGVAAKLIEAAIATARRQGFSAASLEARPSDNGISPQALVAMYRRQGFRNVGRSERGSPMMERKLR